MAATLTEAPPTWDEIQADPRFTALSGGDKLGMLDQWNADVQQHLGDAYEQDRAEPFLNEQRQKIAAEGQSPISTAARSFMTGAGQVATGSLQGLGTFGNDAAAGIDQLTGFPGAGSAVVNQMIPGMAAYRAAVPYAEAAQQGIEDFYQPDRRLNPISATIGGGAGQAVAMLPSMIAGPVGPLALGAMQGYQQGAEQATDLGIQNPFGRMALGAGFAGAEMFTERLGGIGSGPLKEGAQQMINRIAGKGLQTIASEAIEEPLTGVAQDAMSLGAGYLAGTEQAKLDPLMPTAPGYLERRGMEALGGAVGGTVFAGISKLGARGAPQGEPPPPLPGQPPPLPVDGALPTGNEGASDEEFDTVETTVRPAPPAQNFASVNERNVPADATGLIVGEAQDIAGSTPATGTNQEPGIRNPESGIRNPEPAISNQAPVPSIDNIGTKFAPPQVRSVPVIPDSPLGVMDSLDFLNEMPIAIGRSGTGGELDWQETASIPKYYRPFIASEQGQPIDTVAQAAYEANLIPQPTADALMQRVQQDIGARRTYRVQSREQTRDMLAQEKQAVSFDKSQNKLERQPNAQPVPTDALVTGDRMTIDGEEVIVRAVESDEDGYPTKVVLEDGKKFGVQEFNPQTKTGLFVDEFQPRARAEGSSEGPFSKAGPPRSASQSAPGGLTETEAKRWRKINDLAEKYNLDLSAEDHPFDDWREVWRNLRNARSWLEEAARYRRGETKVSPGAIERFAKEQSGYATNAISDAEKTAVTALAKSGQMPKPRLGFRLLGKVTKTPWGSRYYHVDYKGQWWYVRVADHANTANRAGIDDNTQGRYYTTSGMSYPQRLNIVLDEPASSDAVALAYAKKGVEAALEQFGLTKDDADNYYQPVLRGKDGDITFDDPEYLQEQLAESRNEKAQSTPLTGQAGESRLDVRGRGPSKTEQGDSPPSPPAVKDNLTESKAGPQRGLGRGLGALLGTPPPAAAATPAPASQRPATTLTRTMIDQVRALLPAAQRPVGLEEMLSRAENILKNDGNFEVRKTDPTTVPQALQLILSGANPTAIVNRWAEHRNQAVMGQTTAPTPFSEYAATNASTPRDSVMSAYAQLDRTGQGYVRIPDLARASGLPMADVREVLIDLSDRGAAYLTPADEPRNIPPADRSMLVVGPSGPSLYVTMTEQRNASRGAPRPPVPMTAKVSTTLVSGSGMDRLRNRITEAVKAVQDLWQVALPGNTRSLMFARYPFTSDRVNGDIDHQTFEIRIKDQDSRVKTHGAVYHELGHAFHFIANRALGRDTHDNRIIQPLLNYLRTTKSGATLELAAADVQSAMDGRLRTIAKQEKALARWQADPRPVSQKGPAPVVPQEWVLNERDKHLLYLQEPHEQFARAVHAATLYLTREPVNAHADPGWEEVMSFDEAETQRILTHVRAVFTQHLPAASAAHAQLPVGGLQLPAPAGQPAGNANDLGRINGSPGQAPGTPSLAAPGRAAESAAVDDAAYLAAVEAGDMETVQRMVDEAAKVFIESFPKSDNENDVPNLGSISADGGDFTQFGIREVPTGLFSGKGRWAFYDANDHKKVDRLLPSIKDEGVRSPLIVVIDGNADGVAYVMEGAHRLAAIEEAKLPSFPALVLYDEGADPVTRDESGNVIPLSQRFHAADDRITRSQSAPPLKPSGAVPLRAEFGGAAADYAPFEDQAMGDWAARTANALPLEQLAEQIQANRWTPVQSEYLLAQAIVRAETAVRGAKTQADQTRASGLKSRLRAMLDARGTAAGQDLAARRYALAGLRGEISGLAVDDAVEKGQTAVIDPAVGGSVQPAVKGLQDLTNQASAEATDELASELNAEDLDLEAEPSTPAEQSRADEEMIRLRQQLTQERNAVDRLTSTWQALLAAFTSVGQSKGALLRNVKAQFQARRAQRKAAEQVAGNRVQSRGAPTQGITAPNLPETAVEDGAYVIADQGLDRAAWRSTMAKMLGPQFAPQLDALYEQALGLYTQVTQTEAAAINQRVKTKATKQGKGKQGPAAKVISTRFPNLSKMLSQLRPMIAPGLNWKQIFTSTATQQRQWELDTYAAIRQHPALQSLNAEQAKNLTRELSKAWQSKRRTVWKRELNRTLIAAGMAKPKIRAKIEASAPRLLALINLGALDARTFRDAVAKEFGLRSMNDAEVGKIKEAAEKLQGLAPGTVPYRKAAQKFMEGLESLTNLSRAQLLESWWTASVLSGWRTQMDILFGVSNAMEDIGIGAVVGAIRTGNYGVASRAIFATIERAIQAVPEAFQMVVTGNRSLQASFDAEIRAHLEEGYPMMGQAGRQLMAKGGWRTGFGAFQVAMGRIMSALDHITSSGSRAGALWLARANHPEIFAAALNITAQDRANARKQALQILTGGAEPTTTQLKQEVKRYTQELLDARHTLPDIEQQASDVGLQSSLQSDPTGLGFLAYELMRAVPQKADTLADRAAKDNWVPIAVKLLRMGGQFSRVLFGTKFIRTAGNAITRATNYVPGIGALNLMDGRSKIGSPAGDIILGKQMLGLVLFSGLLYAFRDREEEDDMGIEGGWKNLNADQRGQLLNQGKQPYSVWGRNAKGQIVSWNYQQWSIANLLAAVGFTQDQRRYHGVDADAATVAQGLGYGLMTIADKAQLQGISTILGRDNNRSSGADTVKGLNEWAAGLVGGMSPRLVKDIEDVIKPQLPRSDYWWQAWAREVPILRSQSSGARVDIFGREITIDRKPLSRIYQTGTVEPEYQILAKLNQRDVWISDPTLHPRKVKLSTGSRDMLPLEKDRYAREAGKMTKDWLLQTGPQLLQMEPEQAQKMISQRTELIRAMALNRAVRR